MSLSFTKEYFPDIDAVSQSDMTAARAQVVAILQPSMPDVDLAPGTPTGDLVTTVLGAFLAAAEEANTRLMSDLNLENVANGIIFSCDFVRAYLGNFAVYDVDNVRSTGLVRLTYATPEARTVPLATRFRFGSTDDFQIHTSNSASAALRLLAAGSAHDGQPDTYTLTQTSVATWAVDIPLTGSMTAQVTRGASGTATIVPADLIGIAAATTFSFGLPPATLRDLAKMARKAAHALTAGSRSSTQALVLRHWPETAMVSPIVTGDDEMQRSPAGSAMVMQRPAVDVYVRSSHDMQRETQVVKLTYITAPNGDKVFRGALNLLHVPSRIISIEWSGATSESLVAGFTVFSKSVRADLYGNLHCGSRYEALFVEVLPTDPTSSTLIARSEETVGASIVESAMFTVVYDCDPLTAVMASTLESSDNTPPGVSVIVKSGPLVLLDSLTVSYKKKPGVRTALNTAKTQISDYFRTAGHPDPLRQTVIHDITAAAGASHVTDITCTGFIRPSAAVYRFVSPILDPGATQLAGNWATGSIPIEPVTVDAFADIGGSYITELDGADNFAPWAATPRTVRYHVDAENIEFVETP